MKYFALWIVAVVILIIRLVLSLWFAQLYHVGQVVFLKVRLLDEPKISYGKQLISYQHIQISLPADPAYHYGDELVVQGRLQQNPSSKQVNTLPFILTSPEVHTLSKGVLFSAFSNMRNHISEAFNQSLSSREAGLMLGVVFGIKDGIDKQAYTEFKNAGLLHIVAASGANVSILSTILLTTVGVFLRRKWGLLFTAIVILAYTVFAGLQPSIVRAALMAMIALTAGLTGRQNFALSSLGISAFIMLMVSPELIADVGFQLSCAATGGILIIKPRLDSVLGDHIPSTLSTDVTTTLAAQIATIPILLSAFGTFSLISLISNLVVLWLVPILMVLGGVAVVMSYISPILVQGVLILCKPLLAYFFLVVDKLSGMPYQIQIASIPVWFTVGYYILLLAVLSIHFKNSNADVISHT